MSAAIGTSPAARPRAVRVMPVPATMALLGDKNWYAPKRLLKILPHANFNH